MSSGVTLPDENDPAKPKQSGVNKSPVSGKPSEGEITKQIGSGDNARNSIIWVTIRWSFVIATLISVGIYFRPVYCQAEYPGDLVSDVKSVWAVFMPVITLALGYAFGRTK